MELRCCCCLIRCVWKKCANCPRLVFSRMDQIKTEKEGAKNYRIFSNQPIRLYCTIRAANNEATSDITVIIVFNEGPAVSLKGSPTVSPTTAALCASEPLPP